MPELPRGTVTFLFTDIEGSTRLLEQHGERYVELLDRHRRVLREAFSRHGGVEVDTQGDSFFVAFERASDAVAAGEEAQRELEIPVRMGIHTGEPMRTDAGYVGMDVHRAARICAAGHGRQVIISETAARLLAHVELHDLGEHRLKDLGRPVRLYQLGDEDFPPLRSLNQTNLPAQPSELIGREHELAELQQLFGDRPLVTLTGPGGSGKTRLALQVAAELVEHFEGGTFFVPLAAITDPELVLPAIAQVLGAPGGVAEHVGQRELLLLLDNLEQVIEAARLLAELLERCPNLHLLVTSRTPLRIAAEHEYVVDPLPERDAVELFRERATVAEPEHTVQEICRRLDGLPLAIELAAARTRLLPPDQLLERLEYVLPVLTGGRRDAPERQRTLRATIEWSYELLDEHERVLFGRLALFAASFTLEAAEEVCDADLDTLESLLDKSLLRRWDSGRLGMLETIREYAVGLLEASPEAGELRRRHAEFFVALARRASLSVEALYAGGTERHDLVLPEQANIRAALDWAESHDAELGLELAVALEQFWVMQSPIEGMRLIERLLQRFSDTPSKLAASAQRVLAGTSWFAGDYERGHAANEQAMRLYREAGDDLGETTMLFRIGTGCIMKKEDERARALLRESLERFRRLGVRMGECECLGNLGSLELMRGDASLGRSLTQESIDIAHEIGWHWWEASKEADLAEHGLARGDVDAAQPHLRRALELYLAIHDRLGQVYSLALAARLAAARNDGTRAGRLWGAIEAEEERGPLGAWETDYRAEFEAQLEPARGPSFDSAARDGRRLTLEAAVAEALRS